LDIFPARWQRHVIPALGERLSQRVKAAWMSSPTGESFYRHIALQPIFAGPRRIFGYEALYRSSWKNCFSGDSDSATRIMLDHCLLLPELTGEHAVFLNCTREALLSGRLMKLPRLTVFEVLETVEPDKDVVAACRKMRCLGYQIALDDFQLSSNMERLVEIADYVKVDVQVSDKNQRKEILRCLKYSRATAIAEKVETRSEFETAIGEGFSLFQGFHLCRPIMFSRRMLPLSSNVTRPLRLPCEG
jgi:c-di-GMP-related signal transduction protein